MIRLVRAEGYPWRLGAGDGWFDNRTSCGIFLASRPELARRP